MRSRTLGIAVAGLAMLALSPVPAAATHNPDPPQLTQRQAREALRDLLVENYSARRYDRNCGRRSRWNFFCRADFFHGDVEYDASVVIWRTGNAHDAVDHYRYRVRAINRYPFCERNCRRTERGDGVFFQDTRDGPLGGSLVLHSRDRTRVRIDTEEQLLDGLPYNEFDAPAAGTRYVGIPLTLDNIGEGRFEDSLRNDSVLVIDDGRTLKPKIRVDPPCDQGFVNIPEEQTRQGCVVFEVPNRANMRWFELTLDSATGPETGQWDLHG